MAADGLYLLRFEAPETLMDDYTIPGQYAVVHTSPEMQNPAFFAVASSPSDGFLELLIKEAPGAAADLISLKEGEEVECQSIQGPGFPVSDDDTREIHMFSMGSGYAPFRALIRFVESTGLECKLHLWQAAFRLSAVPLLGEMLHWEKQGLLKLHLCLDEQQDSTDVPFFSGQVPMAMAQYKDFSGRRLLWIGSHEFGASLKKAMEELNLDPNQLETNF